MTEIPNQVNDFCDHYREEYTQALYSSGQDGPTSGTAVTFKTGRRKVPGSDPGNACRPSRSEFSVVFSETRVNTG